MNTIYCEQFHKIIWRRLEKYLLLKIIHCGRDLEVQRFPKPRSKLYFVEISDPKGFSLSTYKNV